MRRHNNLTHFIPHIAQDATVFRFLSASFIRFQQKVLIMCDITNDSIKILSEQKEKKRKEKKRKTTIERANQCVAN